MIDLGFYNGKKVFITGHTGFKGSWHCKIFVNSGAEVTGYALSPNSNPNIYDISGVRNNINDVCGDVRDFKKIKKTFQNSKPEIVIHLAAQPLVRESYLNPRSTYETNVMGTINLLECVRISKSVKSVLNVTTDKVYKNTETGEGFKEDDFLDDFDPYFNSKSCSEIATHAYVNCFFKDDVAVSTARAGNVIGGGDFSKNRIVPDCIRYALAS